MKATRIRMIVLSEGEIPETMTLAGIIEECDVGDYVLHSCDMKAKDLTDEKMAKALVEAGSEPAFFLIDLGT